MPSSRPLPRPCLNAGKPVQPLSTPRVKIVGALHASHIVHVLFGGHADDARD